MTAQIDMATNPARYGYRWPVTLRHHGRLTAITGTPGAFALGRDTVTAASCTCRLGGTGCEHSAAARVLTGQIAATPEPIRPASPVSLRHPNPRRAADTARFLRALDTRERDARTDATERRTPVTMLITASDGITWQDAADVRRRIGRNRLPATVTVLHTVLPGQYTAADAPHSPIRHQAEMQQQDRETPTPTTLTRTEAAAALTISPDRVRRLAKTGRLDLAAGTDITAASVERYRQERAANVTRTRAQLHTASDARRIAAAAKAQKQAAALERKARKLREAAKATLTGYGAGLHDGWLISQGPAVDVAAHTRSGSWHATRAA